MTTINLVEADADITGSRVAIVMSKYNQYIGDSLLKGCVAVLNDSGIYNSAITLVKVPGAYEIPVVARKLADQEVYDAIITLGAIIRGETPHFDYIAASCANGIAEVAADYGIPVIFGVLTVDNVQQAQDRAGNEESNKGAEAARAAVEMISIMKKVAS
ncbi:MAG: 6,7-dimethyl-8-ribityllumazine synthase [Gammaproteobacteria bacterium]